MRVDRLANAGSLLYPFISIIPYYNKDDIWKQLTFFKLIILKHTTAKKNAHLGCGFNEEMANKVAGRILKRSLFFIVLHIIFLLNPPLVKMTKFQNHEHLQLVTTVVWLIDGFVYCLFEKIVTHFIFCTIGLGQEISLEKLFLLYS